MTRDVSDVTHRKRGVRYEKSQSVEIETWARPDEFVRYGRRTCWGRGRWKSQPRKIVPLSPYVGKPFNSKVIKSFVPELRSRQVFFVFRDSYVIHIWVINILCTFRIFMDGYVTEIFVCGFMLRTTKLKINFMATFFQLFKFNWLSYRQ